MIFRMKKWEKVFGILLRKNGGRKIMNKVDIIELPRSGGFGNTLPYMLLFGITCTLFGTAYYAGKKKKSE